MAFDVPLEVQILDQMTWNCQNGMSLVREQALQVNNGNLGHCWQVHIDTLPECQFPHQARSYLIRHQEKNTCLRCALETREQSESDCQVPLSRVADRCTASLGSSQEHSLSPSSLHIYLRDVLLKSLISIQIDKYGNILMNMTLIQAECFATTTPSLLHYCVEITMTQNVSTFDIFRKEGNGQLCRRIYQKQHSRPCMAVHKSFGTMYECHC